MILAAVAAVVGGYVLWYGSRPNPEKWVAVANAEFGDDCSAYKRAAAKLGLSITLRYPVPCPGTSMCGGMRGIYLLRSQADQQHELSNEYFNQKRLWD